MVMNGINSKMNDSEWKIDLIWGSYPPKKWKKERRREL